MNEGLTFANPSIGHWVWLVLVVAAVALWRLRGQRRAMSALVAPALTKQLAHGTSTRRKLYQTVCLTLAMISMVLAMARPQMGLETVQQKRTGAAIMIALDVSRSMLATDAVPNRLERAKAEINDLLTLLRGDQVGLIAFAGRAAVLAPLTPDFGFIRLALEDAAPGSVSRGGTRLEEPIRKAVDGFKGVTEASRSIILITDGEDHDSYAREAAAYAAERGVRILAIGLGDPAGTTVQLKDPTTGATRVLEDADGNAVVSRLDSALLEELALKTDGAYIPAGTAALDLDTIYRQHIEPLTRAPMDARDRIVRHDLYQWFVLASLAFILLGLLGAYTRERTTAAAPGPVALLLLALMLHGADVEPAAAQAVAPTSPAVQAQAQAQAPPAATGTNAQPAAPAPAPENTPTVEIPEGARDAYNAGVTALSKGELEAATQLFDAARSSAGTDETVRFNAVFNLGWVAMRRASNLERTAPEQALAQLRQAIERWQQALTLRSEDERARGNIAVAAKQALILEDQLAQREEGPLRAELEALLAKQQKALATLSAAATYSDGASLPSAQVRKLNVVALGVASELQRVIGRVARDLGAPAPATQAAAQAPSANPEDKPPTPAQLEEILSHLGQAQQRISQSRAQVRKRALSRSIRRAARALGALEDAREVLFKLRERIDAAYAKEQAVAAGLTSIEALPTPDTEARTRAWQAVRNVHARNEARMVRLGKALSDAQVEAAERERKAAAASTPGAPTAQGPGKQHLEQAYALWTQARDAMLSAGDALGRENDAVPPEVEATVSASVATAVEKIQDLRRLFFTVIEHLRETRDQQIELTQNTTTHLDVAAGKQDRAARDRLGAAQLHLAERSTAIALGLRQMATQAAAGPGSGVPAAPVAPGGGNAHGGGSAPANPGAQEEAKFTKAAGLVDDASIEMKEAKAALSTTPASPPAVNTKQKQAETLLTEALALLQNQNQNQNSSNDKQQQGDDDQPGQQPDKGQKNAAPQASSGLLQGVRDREAERRERKRARARGNAAVAKDW